VVVWPNDPVPIEEAMAMLASQKLRDDHPDPDRPRGTKLERGPAGIGEITIVPGPLFPDVRERTVPVVCRSWIPNSF
jgi:hypothetical protein